MKASGVKFLRWAAGLFLGAACLMLVLGMTLFSALLHGTDFLTYWLICFLFTGLAAIFALTDLTAVRRRSREEQRDLIKTTLAKTERDANELKKPDPEP